MITGPNSLQDHKMMEYIGLHPHSLQDHTDGKVHGSGVLTVLRIILIKEYMGLESQQPSLHDHIDESTWEWNPKSFQDHKLKEYMGLGVLTVFRIILMMQYMGLESHVIRITLVMEYMGLESQQSSDSHR